MLTEETAYLMVNLLQGVVLSGSGQRIAGSHTVNESDRRQDRHHAGTIRRMVHRSPSLVGGVGVDGKTGQYIFGTLGEGQEPICSSDIATFLEKFRWSRAGYFRLRNLRDL